VNSKKKTSILILLMTIAFSAFSQKVTNEELLDILDIKTFRVPLYKNKQWTIELINDTLQKRRVTKIDNKLNSKTTSLIAVKFDNDTTLAFSLIQKKSTGSKGTIGLKNSRYEFTWNKLPEYLYKDNYIIGTILYEQKDDNSIINLTELLVIRLIPELKL